MDNKLRDILISLPYIKTVKDISDYYNMNVFLVGGIIRDSIISTFFHSDIFPKRNESRQQVLDLDFATGGDALVFGKKVGDSVNGSYFPLDKERSVSRVVIKSPSFPPLIRGSEGGLIILDFSRIRGEGIEDDLRKRDFTINSIAISLNNLFSNNELKLIDPTGGIKDIEERVIRMYDKNVIDDDPLRMLRAIKFESRLGFTMDSLLEVLIEENGYKLKNSSGERVRDELFNILSRRESYRYIQKLKELLLLRDIIPEIDTMDRDFTSVPEQERHYRYLLWDHSLNTLKTIEILLENLSNIFFKRHQQIDGILSSLLEHGISCKEILKLSALMHDAGKPQARIVNKSGEWQFINHEIIGAEMGEKLGQRLKLGNNAIKIMTSIIKNHMRPILLSRERIVTNRAIFRFFRDTQRDGVLICLLSIADIHATRGSGIFDDVAEDIEGLVKRMLDFYFEDFTKQIGSPLISGNEIMERLGIKSGKEIGEILKNIEEYRAEGVILNKEDALKFITEGGWNLNNH
ncbi:MAG: HD domain-containing protein [Nitrospinota bacterium]